MTQTTPPNLPPSISIAPHTYDSREKEKRTLTRNVIQGCWRALLWRDLQDAGVTNTDFVGTLPGQGCGFEYDGENEGHGGFLATNIAAEGLLTGWLEATGPDVVMVHLGTNDVWSNIAAEEIVAALESLVGDMRANNPAMKILVRAFFPPPYPFESRAKGEGWAGQEC